MMESQSRVLVGRTRKLTSRIWLVLSCFAATLLFVLLQGGKLAFMVFVLSCIIMVYLFLAKWLSLAKAKAERKLPVLAGGGLIEAGQSVTIEVQLQLSGIWPIPYLFVTDELQRRGMEGCFHLFELIMSPGRDGMGTVVYQTPPLQRGVYDFGMIVCSAEDMLGVFEHSKSLSMQPQSIYVLAKHIPIPLWEAMDKMLRGKQSHTIAARAQRETNQVNGIRDYIYGDRLSRIHWNATARTGALKSKSFEKEALPRMAIMLDLHQNHYASDESFENAVSVAASLIEYGQANKLATQLCLTATERLDYVSGQTTAHYRSMLKRLVDVHADRTWSIDQLLNESMNKMSGGSFVIVISGIPDHAARWTAMLELRQFVPCFIWSAHEQTSDEDLQRWMAGMKAAKRWGYAVSALSQLPTVMGGRSHET